MYFKIIYNNLVIDILDSIQYVRWLKRGQKFVRTEMTSAHGILASDNLNIYHVDGMPEFDGVKNYKTVHMVEITKDEYDKLNSQIIHGDVIYSDEAAFSKEEKLELELKAVKKQLAAVTNQGNKSTKDCDTFRAQNSEFVEKLESILKDNNELSEKIAAIGQFVDELKVKLSSIISL